MTAREQILERMVRSMQTADDDLRLPMSIWNALADAALRALEQPLPTTAGEILPCTCGHTGYGKHLLGCALYAD